MGENKQSMKGEYKAHKKSGSGSVKSLEHVGSSKHGGIKFAMPKGCIDHSKVKSL